MSPASKGQPPSVMDRLAAIDGSVSDDSNDSSGARSIRSVGKSGAESAAPVKTETGLSSGFVAEQSHPAPLGVKAVPTPTEGVEDDPDFADEDECDDDDECGDADASELSPAITRFGLGVHGDLSQDEPMSEKKSLKGLSSIRVHQRVFVK
jgi:hypothetical protein